MSTARARILVAAAAVALAAALGATGYGLLQEDDEKSALIATAKGEDAAEFRYPATWEEQPRTPADETAGLVLKLKRGNPEASLLVRSVRGRLDPSFSADTLATEVEAALRTGVENLRVLENRRYREASLDVVEISYRQGQGQDPGSYRVVLLVVPTKEQTFYVTSRAAEDAFPEVEKDVREMRADFIRYVHAITSG